LKTDADQETVCFLELKGSSLDHAVKQVLSTYQHVKALAEEKIGREQLTDIAKKACICMHGQAPRNGQRLKDDLIKEFGKGNVCIRHVKHYQLGEFLR
jgi:hypothetical protein